MSQFALPVCDEIIVDNFAGGGGASLGIEMATGRCVDVAVNHDRFAIAMHAANHPGTRHMRESVWAIDPIEVTEGRPVGIAWFSPDCTHFSKAKGGKPVKKAIRGLAWVVLKWAAKAKPRLIFLENVEEFETWGPLTRSGRPCPIRKGQTFQKWLGQLQALGYRAELRTLRACDYGAPTSRKRLFMIARRDGLPIVWPKPTHGHRRQPYRTAAECIDWSIPCPSIFERKRPLAEATLRRIARGVFRYVIDNPEPFIVSLDHQSSPSAEYSLYEPLTTVTAKARHMLVTAFLAKHYGGVTGHGVEQPIGTVTSIDHHALVSAHLVRQFGQSVGGSAEDPVGSITAGGMGKTGLITSHLIKLRGTCRDGQRVDEPVPTITAGGFHIGEVRAFLVKYYGTAVGQSLNEPLHTITAKHRLGLVTVAGDEYQIVDIGMRMLTPRELYRAQGFPDSYIIDPIVDGKPLTKTHQVRMCGNSVSPPNAAALVAANYQVNRKAAVA